MDPTLGCVLVELCTYCKCNDLTHISQGVRGMDPDKCANEYTNIAERGFMSIRDDSCVWNAECPESERVTTTLPWSLWHYSGLCANPTQEPTVNPTLQPTGMPSKHPTGFPTQDPTWD